MNSRTPTGAEILPLADYENDRRVADWRHPVDFFEPEENEDETSALADTLVTALIWCCAENDLTEAGMRLVSLVHHRRPDLLDATRVAIYARDTMMTDSDFARIFAEGVILLESLPDFSPVPLIWGVQAPKPVNIGFRVALMLHALKKGDRCGDPLRKIAALKSRSKQFAGKLEMKFRSLFEGGRRK